MACRRRHGGPCQWDFKVVRPDRKGKPSEADRKRYNHEQAEKAVKNPEVVKVVDGWRRRRQEWLASLARRGVAIHCFTLPTDWRLAIGLAGANPLETSITLHHLYGVPYLPGSGLKGLARAGARLSLDVDEDTDEILAAFGSTARAGLVDVLDAIPLPPQDKGLLEVDVMNPHYPDWYANRAKPSDSQSPRPVFFLTVPAGTRFEFALLCHKRGEDVRASLEKVEGWLKLGLTTLGAGAKTAAGYGYFTE